jgi:hypothetical protein
MTAQKLLNDKPNEAEVERVDQVWKMFNSTTQFLAALKQVMLNRDIPNEAATLDRFLPVMAQVEAHDMNVPYDQPVPPLVDESYLQHKF